MFYCYIAIICCYFFSWWILLLQCKEILLGKTMQNPSTLFYIDRAFFACSFFTPFGAMLTYLLPVRDEAMIYKYKEVLVDKYKYQEFIIDSFKASSISRLPTTCPSSQLIDVAL